ncbi:MAG: VWA domain-containing protein [Polyangiaceae bacterium]|nr:VWA domain-containing protein [Polyangiaceae bacterium]MCW5792698.1 VWA domain-containing protein [Polyangiaceae bacterium]
MSRRLHLRTPLSLVTLSLLAACAGSSPPAPASSAARYDAEPTPASPGVSEEADGAYAGEATGGEPMDDEAMAAEARDEAREAAPPPASAPMASSGASKAGPAAEYAPRRRSGGAVGGRPGEVAVASSGVRAGEWDDNANYQEFKRWLGTQDHLGYLRMDVEQRRFMVVTDSQGRAVPGCKVTVRDAAQRSVTLTTQTSGRALLFPRAEGLRGDTLTADANCQGAQASARFQLGAMDAAVPLRLNKARSLPTRRTIDLAFILDTTGSMSEEIASIKDTIRAVSSQLDTGNVDVRIAMVAFKDVGDEYVTQVHPFTRDLHGFARRVQGIQASGGGDTPEAVNEALESTLTKLDWQASSVGRFAFLVGDAPPQFGRQGASYTRSMQLANHKGVQIFTIAASGMDGLGQVVWRQIAQYTGGSNMFVLRGGAGPQSTGAGDAKSSCGGTHTNYSSGNLDALIVQKVQRELRALDADPMRIAGLGQDERAKPCAERLVVAE